MRGQSLMEFLFQKISILDNDLLLDEYEVKRAIWDCESSKRTRPDGFNFLFIKEFWEISCAS